MRLAGSGLWSLDLWMHTQWRGAPNSRRRADHGVCRGGLGPVRAHRPPVRAKDTDRRHARARLDRHAPQQIRNGAPADVFFAANESFITALAAENLTLRQTNTLYARGRLATVTLKSGGFRIDDLKDLAEPRIKRIAIANPQHAPYGLAAKQAMEAVGLWQTLEPKLVFGENVQQAVQFVRSGSADAGIVARSVADTSDLRWTLVDAGLHAPLDQMAVVLARTKQPTASMSFIEFVNGTEGRFVSGSSASCCRANRSDMDLFR